MCFILSDKVISLFAILADLGGDGAVGKMENFSYLQIYPSPPVSRWLAKGERENQSLTCLLKSS
jgi:hypothetical protein